MHAVLRIRSVFWPDPGPDPDPDPNKFFGQRVLVLFDENMLYAIESISMDQKGLTI
jgi:hypothetical protein